jgi:hypothetical protein
VSYYVFIFVLMCCAVWTLTRLVILETVIDGTRDRVMGWLENRTSLWAVKLYELLGCPWCVSFWVALGIVLVADDPMGWFTWSAHLPLPVLWVAGIRTGGLVIYGFFDGAELSTADKAGEGFKAK